MASLLGKEEEENFCQQITSNQNTPSDHKPTELNMLTRMFFFLALMIGRRELFALLKPPPGCLTQSGLRLFEHRPFICS